MKLLQCFWIFFVGLCVTLQPLHAVKKVSGTAFFAKALPINAKVRTQEMTNQQKDKAKKNAALKARQLEAARRKKEEDEKEAHEARQRAQAIAATTVAANAQQKNDQADKVPVPVKKIVETHSTAAALSAAGSNPKGLSYVGSKYSSAFSKRPHIK